MQDAGRKKKIFCHSLCTVDAGWKSADGTFVCVAACRLEDAYGTVCVHSLTLGFFAGSPWQAHSALFDATCSLEDAYGTLVRVLEA